MKKKALLLSFVGATVLTLGLQSQQTFANTYANRTSKNNSYRSNQRDSKNHSNSNRWHYFNDWCEDIITRPTPKPETPETKPETPETKPETPETKPETPETPETKPETPETKPETPETKPETPETKPETPETKPETPEVDDSINSFESKVVELTNAERAKQGLSALKIDNELSKVARLKSQDMNDKKYFSHDSPTYGSPFDMMKQFGISYRSAGENIAKGQRTPEEVVNAWMNSPGHRQNILGNYTHIGVGYISSGNIWTQMFISK